MTDKVKENRLRLTAERRGFKLKRSRRRDPQAVDFGGYMLVDIRADTVVLGGGVFSFQASLEEVEAYLGAPLRHGERP
ncbi:MAG: hypothetical protein K0S56_930 [Microvirga sp.]|jgi:hypothetical protein|nr:hypothetical protein [Microvirga sp.]